MKLTILLICGLFVSQTSWAEIYESPICDIFHRIDFKEIENKPSDPKYLPLFFQAQYNYDITNGPERYNIESVENLCNVSYDCGDNMLDETGNIEFKDCPIEEEYDNGN